MSSNGYFEKVQEAAQFLKTSHLVPGTNWYPRLVLVLSGGLEGFLKNLNNPVTLSSFEIPHFPKAMAEGHSGELIFGKIGSLPLVVLKGRYHYYEGLSPQDVVFPYFVLNKLGAKILVATNAVGGVRSNLKPADVMLIEDHINMMGTNPLIGLSVQRPKDQFPSMQKAYDPQLISITQRVAKSQKLNIQKGVYLAYSGPSYETPSEIRAFRKMGADCVGMSTVLEVIAARFLKMRVLTISVVTNPAADRHRGEMGHKEVLRVMKKAEGKVVPLLQGVVEAIAKQKVPGTFGSRT